MFPLDGVRLKIKRAGLHREAFERELIEFFSHEPERAVTKFNEESGAPELFLTQPLPPEWSTLLGDFFQNLREAFDHFVWAAALRHRPNPSRTIAFPITRDKPAWEQYLTTRAGVETRKAVGHDAWKLIAEMQPHNRPRPNPDPNTDPLWAMNELARIDRHQTLHTAIATSNSAFIGFMTLPRRGNVVDESHIVIGDPPPPFAGRFMTPPLEGDHHMGKWSLSEGGVESEVSSYGQLRFDVVLDPDSPWGPHTFISPLLTALYQSVRNHCLPRMEMVFGEIEP